MKSFKFSEQEVELLIAMYEDELKEVTDYTDRLKETLSKLRNEPAAIEKPVTARVGKKRGRKPKAAANKPVTGKKRGRKPKSQVISEPGLMPEAAAAPKAVAEKASKKRKTKKRGRKAKTVKTPVIIPTTTESII